MTQREQVLAMLREGPTTTADFLQAHLPRFSARVEELRKEGHLIESRRVREGSWVYELKGAAEPPSRPPEPPQEPRSAPPGPGTLLNRFHPRSCGSCGARIVFLKTTSGKAMPLDPEPVEGGNVRIRDGIALVNSDPDLLDDGFRYQSHFASCPNADRHRRTDAA